MAKNSGLPDTPHALDTKHHFASAEEIEGRNKQTRKNHPVNFTQIAADANPGMNLANPSPRNISGDFKLSKSPL
jgi:hypothetical protein